jgi:uncharacterized repeat protein (TIGR03803 family)
MGVFRLKTNQVGLSDTTYGYGAGGWAGSAGPSTGANEIPFDAIRVPGGVAIRSAVAPAARPNLDTLVSFEGGDGNFPSGSLIADAAGDLFGTTSQGGADGFGTVFEIAKTKHGYASTPTTLVSFTGANGKSPDGSLIADAAGDLFGTTAYGGADGFGTVFEIAKTRHGYASAPSTLVSFTGADGKYPFGSLIADAAGDLFGTSEEGGADNEGTVFEIAKTEGGYGAPTTLVSFSGANGQYPVGSLIADAAGDLFGTTSEGGADGDGTVFEIVKTEGGYATTPTTLVSFTGADKRYPLGSLIADAAGDLFGTTEGGGIDDNGTVFEIVKTEGGYATTPITLVKFNGANGAQPSGSLIANAAGDLLGTTARGGAGDGTVFEITHSGFVPPAPPAAPPPADIAHSSPTALAFAHSMAAFPAGRFGTVSPTVSAAGHQDATVLARPQTA